MGGGDGGGGGMRIGWDLAGDGVVGWVAGGRVGGEGSDGVCGVG